AYAISFGQNVPQGIAYQAVAVKDGAYSVAGQNPQAIYWSNKYIKVRFTILDTYPNGSSQYSEVHETTTDDYGVFNLIIGQGNSISGDFTTIPWELGDAHLQVEIDFENTDIFTLTALEKFWSVPYAFVTNETGISSTDSSLAALDSLNKALKAEIAALRSGDQDTVVGNEIQQLSLNNDTISLSNGGGKVALVSAWLTEGDTISTFNQVGIGSKSTYPGVELILKDGVFASQVIETTGPTTDAELWLKNPTGTWRMHGDQSDANKLKFGLWTDYSEVGGSNIFTESMTIDTLGRVGVGSGVNFKEAFNVYHRDSAFLQIETGGNNKAGIVMGELDGARGGRIIVDGDKTNNLIFQVTDDKGQSSGQIPEYVDVMHLPYYPASQVGNVGIGTSNPSSSLHINSSSSKTGLLIENTGTTSAKFVLNQAGSANGQAYYLVSRNDGNFVIGNASNGIADQFVIDSLGRVGIGTNNPTHSLEVLGSGYGGAQALKLKRNRNKPNFGVILDFNLLNSKNEDTKYGNIIGSIADSTAGAEKGFLSLGVANGSGTWSNGYTEERLRIETDRVTVKNIMRLKPLSAAPASPLEGDVYMNSVSHKLMVYDGTTWQACW
ncbi:hypothetical protein N9772_07165, partial [Bacteroidia bacterium]|nr:hypothetical protein [Bacteroidia bacterium]